MIRSNKVTKKTPIKKSAKSNVKIVTKTKPKIKPKFNLKGVPVKFKMICNLAIEHADTQTQCDELLLVGVNAYETLLERETPENAEKLKMQIVTEAILIKKSSYPPII